MGKNGDVTPKVSSLVLELYLSFVIFTKYGCTGKLRFVLSKVSSIDYVYLSTLRCGRLVLSENNKMTKGQKDENGLFQTQVIFAKSRIFRESSP